MEINQGLKQSSLSFCHWNLNGVAAHEFIKVSLLQGYITERDLDICLSETFLNSSLDSEDGWLKIEGYNLIRSDQPSGSKKGGVCVYYKEHIPLLRRYDLCTLSNCLVTKFVWKSKSASLPVITDHQTQHELENFCTSLDTLMDHINNELTILLVITGDLNAGCSK